MMKSKFCFVAIILLVFLVGCPREPKPEPKPSVPQKPHVEQPANPTKESNQTKPEEEVFPTPEAPKSLLDNGVTKAQKEADILLITDRLKKFLNTDEFKKLELKVGEFMKKDNDIIPVELFELKVQRLSAEIRYLDEVNMQIKTKSGWDFYIEKRSKIRKALLGGKKLIGHLKNIPVNVEKELRSAQNPSLYSEETKTFTEITEKIINESGFNPGVSFMSGVDGEYTVEW